MHWKERGARQGTRSGQESGWRGLANGSEQLLSIANAAGVSVEARKRAAWSQVRPTEGAGRGYFSPYIAGEGWTVDPLVAQHVAPHPSEIVAQRSNQSLWQPQELSLTASHRRFLPSPIPRV